MLSAPTPHFDAITEATIVVVIIRQLSRMVRRRHHVQKPEGKQSLAAQEDPSGQLSWTEGVI